MTRTPREILAVTAVVIPAYNAAAHLTEVIERTSKIVPATQIIVVDDGSADETYQVAVDSGAVVVRHKENQGKGAALKTGIDTAIERGMEYVVTIDADAQHKPEEIPAFIEHQAEHDPGIIVGNRMHDRKDMPAIRIFANRVTSAFVSLRAGQKIPDSQNGFRMMKTSIFRHMRLETKRYDTESEMLIKAGRNGAVIDSIPVETIYGTEVSSVNPFVDTLRFFRMVFKSLFW